MNLLLQLKYAFYTTLVFFLMACPETYKTVQHLASFTGLPYTLSTNGLPTLIGIGVQSVLFFTVMVALLSIPRT
jgi:hypothetical protein